MSLRLPEIQAQGGLIPQEAYVKEKAASLVRMEPVPLCRCCNPAFMSSDEEWDDDMWEDPRPREATKETNKLELDREWQTRREQHFNVSWLALDRLVLCRRAGISRYVRPFCPACRVAIAKAKMLESRRSCSKHSMKVCVPVEARTFGHVLHTWQALAFQT